MIDRLRTWIIKIVGQPKEFRELIDYLDTFDSPIIIYCYGQYKFSLMSHDDSGEDMESIIFPTAQEREAFSAGLAKGIETMGGSTAVLSQEQINDMNQRYVKPPKKPRLN